MRRTFVAILAVAGSMSAVAFAADREVRVEDRLDASADTLIDMMRAADKGIPQDLINKARCVVVVPGMKKAGFIVAAKFGRGFAMCRTPGGWSAPVAVRVEGGSFGFQIGASDTDVILLVRTKRGMDHLLASKFTLGADASIAAGPVGRESAADTDVTMHAEILSWSRSRGVFAGIALQGATLRPDEDVDKDLYGHEINRRDVLNGKVPPPPAAVELVQTLTRYSGVGK